ncbi:hypothetical protein [Roseobacter sp.]|uniref:hypothetical protein n=1 Tax=Roseobacter sp. TaxID=1907202 RepID=UPI0032995631
MQQINHAIVGNGPLSDKDKRCISEAAHITRFNLTPNLADVDDSRTSCLVIVNRSKQINQYFRDQVYLSHGAFQKAARIVMPYDESIIRDFFPRVTLRDRIKRRLGNWAPIVKDMAEKSGKSFGVLSREDYTGACEALGYEPKNRAGPFPSTGFLAIYKSLSDAETPKPIDLFGFAFSGWKRHAWSLEEAFVLKAIERGQIVLHRSDRPVTGETLDSSLPVPQGS